jgi:hypothetical protein
MYGAKGGWAVGYQGTILHYDGLTWVEIVRPVTDDLFSVIADKDQGWAVGSHGTIVRYANGSWTKVSSPTSANLYSLSVVYSNPLQFWAVGDQGTILHYTGTSWEVVQCPCQKVEEGGVAAGSFGPGVFAVIGIGAVMAAVGIGLVVALSSSEVYAHGGHYYCRKHNVPVVTVSGRPWCPVEGRYLRS